MYKNHRKTYCVLPILGSRTEAKLKRFRARHGGNTLLDAFWRPTACVSLHIGPKGLPALVLGSGFPPQTAQRASTWRYFRGVGGKKRPQTHRLRPFLSLRRDQQGYRGTNFASDASMRRLRRRISHNFGEPKGDQALTGSPERDSRICFLRTVGLLTELAENVQKP